MQPESKRDKLAARVLLFAGVIDPRMERLHKIHVEHLTSLVESGTEADLEDFLARATDVELLHWFSQRSLEAPLKHDAFRAYMWLFNSVFRRKLEIPDDIRAEDKPLDLCNEQMLERLRTDLRAAQLKRLGQTAKKRPAPSTPRLREEMSRGGDIRLDVRYHLGARTMGFINLC